LLPGYKRRMSAMIECAFINSVITTDTDRDHDINPASRRNDILKTCAQQDTMEKRISGLRMMWLRPSAAPEKSGYVSALTYAWKSVQLTQQTGRARVRRYLRH
jgi:hypothetical protein